MIMDPQLLGYGKGTIFTINYRLIGTIEKSKIAGNLSSLHRPLTYRFLRMCMQINFTIPGNSKVEILHCTAPQNDAT